MIVIVRSISKGNNITLMLNFDYKPYSSIVFFQEIQDEVHDQVYMRRPKKIKIGALSDG